MSFPPEDWTQWAITLGGISVVFAVWILLFTAGILVDTEPYRRIISPQGAQQMGTTGPSSTQDSRARTSVDGDTLQLRLDHSTLPPSDTIPLASSTGPPRDYSRANVLVTEGAPPTDSTVWAFLVVLFCFTPSNLAFLCCLAGVLGAMGRQVVLTTEGERDSRDRTYPLLSALLRSFFVYLTVISGLLVLLENPILGTASPGQYIRFAGLLSLIGFFVSYDPTMFVALLDRVRDRMRERTVENVSEASNGDATANNE